MDMKKDDTQIMIDLLQQLVHTMDDSSMDRMNPKTADDSMGKDMSMDAMDTDMDDTGANPNAQDGETVMAEGSEGDDMEGSAAEESGETPSEESSEDMAMSPDKGSKYRGNRLLARLNMKG